MQQDMGASLRDRAVVNGAGQAVSALRASVPSAVEGEVVCSFNPQIGNPTVPADVKVERILRFLGEQEEREAVVDWLRSVGDRKPHGTDWRTYYEIADAIEIGRHRDSDRSGEASETRSGSTVGESAGRQASPKAPPPSPTPGDDNG